jgi:Tfp pilus assembly protein PilO
MARPFNSLFIRYIVRQSALKAALIFLFTACLLCLIASGLWWNSSTESEELARDVSRLRKQQVMQVKLKKSTELATSSLQQLETLERMLERNFSQTEMARQLTELAEKNDLKVDTQTYAEQSPAAGYIAYQQEIALAGSYSALRRYLLDLQRSAAWIEIGEIRLQRANNRPGIVQALLRVAGYRQAKAQ